MENEHTLSYVFTTVLSRANTMYLNRVQMIENALKENNLNRIHLKDLTEPEIT